MGRMDTPRKRPFRFILNESNATATNAYLMMYPKPGLERAVDRESGLMRRIWSTLNSTSPDEVLSKGRVYGGGLFKVEPKELGRIRADRVLSLIGKSSIKEMEVCPRQFST